MSKKTTWADVKRGSIVELGGREWTVTKWKPGKKKGDVTIEHKGRKSSSTVKLADRVTIVKKGDGTKRGPLRDDVNAQRRWASQKEHDAVLGTTTTTLATGDADVTTPPGKLSSDVWETPSGKVERMLGDLLSARLVGIATDEKVGHYVPPVNVTTVAAHLALFHGGISEACQDDEGAMMKAHDAQHAEALRGMPLAVNHWHTATRPAGA